MIAAENKRQRRQKEVSHLKREGLKEIGKLTKRDIFLAGLAMYWSEGYTSDVNDEVGFSNSNPQMVLFMLKWFKEICKISKNRFILRVGINKNYKNKAREIEKYWSSITGISLIQFTKPSIKDIQTKKLYNNPSTYYGTLRIKVRRGTRLRRKLMGWIEGLKLKPG